MDRIQLIYPYYENPGMLKLQIKNWNSMPWQLKERFKIILVDDGSPNSPAVDVLLDNPLEDVNLELYRVLEDIPWNQNGAHNLGMNRAADGWCLVTDIDHIVVPSEMNKLFDLKAATGKYYTFARRQIRELQVADFKRHPNSWLLTKEMYWKSGGYDEDFAGHYGSDSVFRTALRQAARGVVHLDIHLVVCDEHDLPDANTRHFGKVEPGGIRKDSKYHSANDPKLAQKRRHWTKAVDPIRFKWVREL